MVGLTISYEKWVYSLILTPHHSLHNHHLHHITHPELAATPCPDWNMNLLLFPPALSQAKCIQSPQLPWRYGAGKWKGIFSGGSAFLCRSLFTLKEIFPLVSVKFRRSLKAVSEVCRNEGEKMHIKQDEELGLCSRDSWWLILNGIVGYGRAGGLLRGSTTESSSWPAAVSLTNVEKFSVSKLWLPCIIIGNNLRRLSKITDWDSLKV